LLHDVVLSLAGMAVERIFVIKLATLAPYNPTLPGGVRRGLR